mmetsp:Transcript_47721/g.102242  ORF Transcript_47721/g.102242 Transcript_47721/m.102242 type:complete len:612 (+) Transcript_47721:580-2415(+)
MFHQEGESVHGNHELCAAQVHNALVVLLSLLGTDRLLVDLLVEVVNALQGGNLRHALHLLDDNSLHGLLSVVGDDCFAHVQGGVDCFDQVCAHDRPGLLRSEDLHELHLILCHRVALHAAADCKDKHVHVGQDKLVLVDDDLQEAVLERCSLARDNGQVGVCVLGRGGQLGDEAAELQAGRLEALGTLHDAQEKSIEGLLAAPVYCSELIDGLITRLLLGQDIGEEDLGHHADNSLGDGPVVRAIVGGRPSWGTLLEQRVHAEGSDGLANPSPLIGGEGHKVEHAVESPDGGHVEDEAEGAVAGHESDHGHDQERHSMPEDDTCQLLGILQEGDEVILRDHVGQESRHCGIVADEDGSFGGDVHGQQVGADDRQEVSEGILKLCRLQGRRGVKGIRNVACNLLEGLLDLGHHRFPRFLLCAFLLQFSSPVGTLLCPHGDRENEEILGCDLLREVHALSSMVEETTTRGLLELLAQLRLRLLDGGPGRVHRNPLGRRNAAIRAGCSALGKAVDRRCLQPVESRLHFFHNLLMGLSSLPLEVEALRGSLQEEDLVGVPVHSLAEHEVKLPNASRRAQVEGLPPSILESALDSGHSLVQGVHLCVESETLGARR